MENAPEGSCWLLVVDDDESKHEMGKCQMAVAQTGHEREE